MKIKTVISGLLLVLAFFTAISFASSEELSPIVNIPDLPVCDIETLKTIEE